MSEREKDVLHEALAIQLAASEKGFDWTDVSDVIGKVREEIVEIEEALSRNDHEETKRELGDLLFAVVNLSRFLKADPSASLNFAIRKFSSRFSFLEEEFAKQNRTLKSCSLEELDAVWESVKRKTHDAEKNGLT